jgi:hypothetical protein
MTFLAIGASGPLLIDAQGSARSLVANGSPWTVDAAPGIDGHSVYHFDYTTGRLEVLDVGGGEPRLLPPVTTGNRDRSTVALSPAGGRLAAVVYRDGRPELLLRDMDGGDEASVPLDPGASTYSIDWSPDGRHLLLVVYPANAPREANYRILDAPGNVVASGGGAPRWAGNDGLLFNVSVNNSPILPLDGGAPQMVSEPGTLLCVSPDGVFGIFAIGDFASPTLKVVKLATHEAIASIAVSRSLISCDWTADSTRAVLSPGGK